MATPAIVSEYIEYSGERVTESTILGKEKQER
jgi:hypothetical protein